MTEVPFGFHETNLAPWEQPYAKPLTAPIATDKQGRDWYPAMHSGDVDAHLRDVHGLSIADGDGPCEDSNVSRHNILHWPQAKPTHHHIPRITFETWAKSLRTVAPHLTDEQLSAVWAMVQEMGEELRQATSRQEDTPECVCGIYGKRYCELHQHELRNPS